MPGETIRLVDPQGGIRDVPVEAAAGALDSGWAVPTGEQEVGRVAEQAREVNYGGVGGAIKAGVAGVARGVTLGGSDALARLVGGDDAAIELEGLRTENPGISTATEVGGALGASLLTAGAATPAGLVGRAGRAVTELGAEAGTLGKIGYGALGGATEGALFGAGQGVSELALSEDPLSLEHVASALSSNALYGAALGGGIGGLGKAAELGLRRAKGAIDGALEKRALSKAKTPTEAIETGDLQHIDKRILDTAQKAEVERIAAEQAPQRKEFTDELSVWRKANRDEHEIRTIAKASGDPNLSEASGAFDRANIELRKALDNKIKFASDPLRSLDAVQRQGQALEEMKVAAQAHEARWRQDVAEAPVRIRQEIQAGKVAGEVGPFTEQGLDLAVERTLKEYQGLSWNGAVRGGLKAPSILSRMPKIEEMIAANQRLQGQLEMLAKPPTSELLTKIADARAVIEGPKPAPSGLGAVASAVVPFAGPVGAAAAAGGKVIGSFKKLAAAAGERLGKATSSFLSAAIPATKYAVPLATKTLASVRYADAEPGKHAPEPTKLPELYKARTTEIKNQVHIAMDGTFQMRPEAREKLAAKFDGIRMADPRGADQLETKGADRIEYLASIMPRLPDFGTVRIGPERRNVSELAMRSWARAAAALEDPHAVLEAAAHGRVTPEAAAAIRAVYPELLADFTAQVTSELPTLKKTLHPAKRLALSILTGQPIDPAMTPAILGVIQGMYRSEPGTEGGTQAPRAEAQFGSVKRSDPGTASQQRQEHA